jgi:hypothetical protein
MPDSHRFDLARFHAVATAADMAEDHIDGVSRAWSRQRFGASGYPQRVLRDNDVALIAETFEGSSEAPDDPPRFAEHIATFDPPTVLALVEIVSVLAADLDRFDDEILTNRGWRVCIACGELACFRTGPCVRCGERNQDFEAVAFRPGWDPEP